MKRKTAKEILAESFREVAETKSIDKITIRDIVDNCGYSPATFYRQFSDKYDLIAWDYVDRTTVIIDKVGVDAYQWKHTWADAVKFYSENREYMLNLLKNTAGHDAFVRYLSEANRHFRIDRRQCSWMLCHGPDRLPRCRTLWAGILHDIVPDRRNEPDSIIPAQILQMRGKGYGH